MDYIKAGYCDTVYQCMIACCFSACPAHVEHAPVLLVVELPVPRAGYTALATTSRFAHRDTSAAAASEKYEHFVWTNIRLWIYDMWHLFKAPAPGVDLPESYPNLGTRSLRSNDTMT